MALSRGYKIKMNNLHMWCNVWFGDFCKRSIFNEKKVYTLWVTMALICMLMPHSEGSSDELLKVTMYYLPLCIAENNEMTLGPQCKLSWTRQFTMTTAKIAFVREHLIWGSCQFIFYFSIPHITTYDTKSIQLHYGNAVFI